MRAEKGGREGLRPQACAIGVDVPRLDEAALRAHVGREKLFENGARFGAPRDDQEPALQDRDFAASATSAHTSRERRARLQHSPTCWPVTVTKPKFLTEAPLACRSRSTSPLAPPARRQGMGEAADAGADNGDIQG